MEEGSMSRKTLKTIATLAAVLATAAVVPPTSEANTDLRSPDSRDAATIVVVHHGPDLRSPDGRDAARPSWPRVPSATPDNSTDWGEIGMITRAGRLALGRIGAVLYVSR